MPRPSPRPNQSSSCSPSPTNHPATAPEYYPYTQHKTVLPSPAVQTKALSDPPRPQKILRRCTRGSCMGNQDYRVGYRDWKAGGRVEHRVHRPRRHMYLQPPPPRPSISNSIPPNEEKLRKRGRENQRTVLAPEPIHLRPLQQRHIPQYGLPLPVKLEAIMRWIDEIPVFSPFVEKGAWGFASEAIVVGDET